MAMEEVHDIVIVGGGISGLALSLGLHRKGIKSLVLERSKVLRSEGAAIGVHGNGWHALDQLKVGTDLRNCSIPLTGMHYEYLKKDEKNVKTYRRELRCLRRKDLIETLARYLPAEQIRFGCMVTSLDFDHGENLHVLTTRDGAIIKAKVLVGCEGLHSMVANTLQLSPPKFFPIWITRGFAMYPDGHHFGNHFLRYATETAIYGRLPIDDKNVHFFALFHAPAGDMSNPEVVREYTMKQLKGAPSEIVESVRICDMETLTMRQAAYRSPWAIYQQNFRKGTMTVAGDAMHIMGSFIGQGGSAALEDAVVLTRCLSNVMINAPANASSDEEWTERVGEALDLYVKERRPRLLRLTMQSYLVGILICTKSWLVKLVVIFLLSVFFGGNNLSHALYDCGTI